MSFNGTSSCVSCGKTASSALLYVVLLVCIPSVNVCTNFLCWCGAQGNRKGKEGRGGAGFSGASS
jgi:hypothetical protein